MEGEVKTNFQVLNSIFLKSKLLRKENEIEPFFAYTTFCLLLCINHSLGYQPNQSGGVTLRQILFNIYQGVQYLILLL
jgi:hypothetical protein